MVSVLLLTHVSLQSPDASSVKTLCVSVRCSVPDIGFLQNALSTRKALWT